MATLVLRNTKGSPLTNAEVDGNFTNLNDDIQTRLLAATYTPADILTKIKTVDGSGSGLDADLLDGLTSNWELPTNGDKSSIVARDASGNSVLNQLSLTGNLTGTTATFTGTVNVGGLNVASGSLPVANGGTGATTAQNARTNLGLAIGTDVQAYDAQLNALAAVTVAADQIMYFTSSTAAAATTLSAYGRTLIDDADAVTARATLGVRIGTDVQAYDADLVAIAAISTNGIIVRTGNGTASPRSIAGVVGDIDVTNADGVAGNPTLSVGTNIPRLASNNVFAGTTNTFQAVLATSYQTSSDERLKKNIETLNNCVDIVENLRGVAFVRDGRAQIGLIAQEVERVLPQVVGEDSNGYKTVEYANIVGVLVGAIQEQQKIIKDLTSRLDRLEN